MKETSSGEKKAPTVRGHKRGRRSDVALRDPFVVGEVRFHPKGGTIDWERVEAGWVDYPLKVATDVFARGAQSFEQEQRLAEQRLAEQRLEEHRLDYSVRLMLEATELAIRKIEASLHKIDQSRRVIAKLKSTGNEDRVE
jgi:hypothetical protein